MSPAEMPLPSDSQFYPYLEALRLAPTGPGKFSLEHDLHCVFNLPIDAKAAADRLVQVVSKSGLESLQCV